MASDINQHYLIINLLDCVNVLSHDEVEQLNGMMNKIELNCPRDEGYIVVSKSETPKLFDTVNGLLESFYERKSREIQKKMMLEARFHIDCFYELDKIPDGTEPDIVWSQNSPDAGDKNCICSKCGKLIPENEMPIRLFKGKSQ